MKAFFLKKFIEIYHCHCALEVNLNQVIDFNLFTYTMILSFRVIVTMTGVVIYLCLYVGNIIHTCD